MTIEPPLIQNNDALFLDFDGTLVEFAARPDFVHLPPRLTQTLRALQDSLQGALAIVTGRRFADVQAYLQPLMLPGAGQHGAELFTHGKAPQAPENSPRAQGVAAALRARFANIPGVLIEDKGLSVSLHYRNAPEREPECVRAVQDLAAQFGLFTMHGKQVTEARARDVTKGDGIRALMELPEFRGRRPVFAGDDVTDEHGFVAVKALGGNGIKVGAGGSAARFALTDVTAVHDWLERSLQALP